MKKTIKSLAVIAALGFSTGAFAQLQDEKNVTVTMDLQPILQLNMQGPENLDFTFNTLAQYTGGITKYGATQLTVSSTVSWDLYAVGFSSQATTNWDQAAKYGAGLDPNAVSLLPISLLELHQNQANPLGLLQTGGFVDYFTAFAPATAPVAGQNSIYASTTPYVAPATTEKYIAGGFDPTDFVGGGTYLTQTTAVNNYRYILDYRIVPGLPAVFPCAGDNVPTSQALVAPQYAQSGIYTMNVKYVLVENQ